MATKDKRSDLVNKICKIKHLKPNYINIKINANKQRDKKTTTNAVRYQINQEIKFLYRKIQNLNHQLYHIHLQCMQHCNGLWQHIQNSIDSQINDFMDKTYLKLNKKLDSLTKQTNTMHNTERKEHTFHSRVINLTNVNFTREQTP